MSHVNTAELDALASEVGPMLIANQNDLFRSFLTDSKAQVNAALHGTAIQGQVVMTQGVNAMGHDFMTEAMTTVAQFDSFNEDNDPHGDHSFGAFELEGQKLFWKIDLYDADYRYGAENPSNLGTTRRVLTIMLASEY